MDRETQEKIGYFGLGVGSGALTHHFASEVSQELRDEGSKFPHGTAVGSTISLSSLLMKNPKKRNFTSGFGQGVSWHDIFYHLLKKQKINPFSLGDTDSNLLDKWVDYLSHTTQNYHINPALPIHEKEAQILPLFPKIIQSMRNKKHQILAVYRVKRELQFPFKQRPTITDFYRLQSWFLGNGKYEGDEGLFIGHDRFRTLSKLLDERDRLNFFHYDCDDGAICTNQIIDSYGLPTFFLLISQKLRRRQDRVSPLHHILPMVMIGRTAYAVETIPQRVNGRYVKSTLPIKPIQELGQLFKNLQRVVIVRPNGTFFEYNGWRRNIQKAPKPPDFRPLIKSAEQIKNFNNKYNR